MPILCEECGSEMRPNIGLNFIQCPKCSKWTRVWARIYELVLRLEPEIEALKQVNNELERRLKISERKIIELEYVKGEF